MKDFSKHIVYALIILVLVSGVWALITDSFKPKKEISISELVTAINGGEVQKIAVQESDLEVTLKDGTIRTSRKEIGVGLVELLRDYGITEERLKGIAVEVKGVGGFAFWAGAIIPFLAPILLIGFFIWWTARQVQKGSMQAFSFGQSRARLISPESKERLTFKDVAGVKEAKEELKEVVDFLKNPKKFLEIGAKIPKGVLLMGPPGSGKTLLAKAVAGEASVPFFHISASEFIEMFVGVGASVTGNTPVLIRENGTIRLRPIQEVIDKFYEDNGGDFIVPVEGLETLGMRRAPTGFRGFKNNPEKFNLGGSRFVSVKGVYRHRADTIYEIHYRGGVIRATGDHGVFVREKNYVREKRVDELTPDDCLVNLPFKVRSVFMPGIGTTHKVKAHEFDSIAVPELGLWEEEYQEIQEKYQWVLAHAGQMTQKQIGARVGVSQATAGSWVNREHLPKFFNRPSIHAGLPSKIMVTPDLMRLLGYYLAEGRTTEYYTQFVFGTHEIVLHEDCVALLQRVFSQMPFVKHIPETNSTRITVSSRVLAEFFTRHCGTGSHKKHLPEWVWNLPWEYVYELVKGYTRGDGYVTGEQKLCVTSVSQRLIQEIAWLLSMHGVQVGIGKTISPAGRIIGRNRKPLPETVSWRLSVGKTSNLWHENLINKSPNQFKKPKVLKIVKKAYQGYVYDLVGCDGEAFFGGEKPTLLHNSRVRDTFRLAKKAAPAIIFVDELDAVGRIRGAGIGGGHDEREQTLNQLLVEMDGMETDDKVLVFSATNRPDILDPALLRPGRFDRRVVLDLPDISDRADILKIHIRNKPLADDTDLQVIATRTPGFSGADLANLVNEAAILAARESRKKVAQMDLIRSIEKVMLGPERKSRLLSPQEKKISAYHEAGHALVAASLKYADPVHKISIVSRGRAAGYTLKLPTEDRHFYSRSYFLDELAVSLGGYVTEHVVFNEITTGASDDLRKATDLARSLVTRFGMSEKIGPMALGEREELIFLGRELTTERNYSEETARLIDQEVKKLIDQAHKCARYILTRRRQKLDKIAARLIEKETIEREEFRTLMQAA